MVTKINNISYYITNSGILVSTDLLPQIVAGVFPAIVILAQVFLPRNTNLKKDLFNILIFK